MIAYSTRHEVRIAASDNHPLRVYHLPIKGKQYVCKEEIVEAKT
jgi:hypothetical protein